MYVVRVLFLELLERPASHGEVGEVAVGHVGDGEDDAEEDSGLVSIPLVVEDVVGPGGDEGLFGVAVVGDCFCSPVGFNLHIFVF